MSDLTLFVPGSEPEPSRPDWLASPVVLRWSSASFGDTVVLKAIVVCPAHPSGEAALTEAVATAVVAGYSKPRDALAGISAKFKTRINVQSSGRYSQGRPDLGFLTREGVNRIILDSTKPEAGRLKDWLAEDVLPSIEDTGGYVAPMGDPLDELAREAGLRDRAIAGWRAEREARQVAEARAKVAEEKNKEVAAAGGLILRQFRKKYFPDVGEKVFLAHCYFKGYLIDQRPCHEDGTRKRDADGDLVYGPQHNHPGHAGLGWLKLEETGVHGKKRRVETRVRAHTELAFVERLVQDGLPRYDRPQIGGVA